MLTEIFPVVFKVSDRLDILCYWISSLHLTKSSDHIMAFANMGGADGILGRWEE